MRVRYIGDAAEEEGKFNYRFNSRYAGKIHQSVQQITTQTRSFNSRYAGKIHRTVRVSSSQAYGCFNSRYAGKIHLLLLLTFAAVESFNSRYAGKIHRRLRMREEADEGFNSRYAGKIHPGANADGQRITCFNSRYAGKIHQQKQRKTLPLTMASLCKTPFFLFIVYHICLHLSTFYPNFTDFVLIFRRRLVRVSSFSSRFYSGFSGSRTWPVPVPAQNAKDF